MDRSSILLLSIPLVLSTFTHLYNPIGFPSVYTDEDTYMRRAMVVLESGSPLLFDHPYFGWLFLGGLLGITGYPDSVHPSPGDVHSIEMLYFVPRVLMGILAVVDTFIIYKISEHRYNRRVAFIASVLFAVMPFTWLTRRILLDSIQLPFLLSSILFAVYAKKSRNENKNKNNDSTNNITLVLLSGIFLGLAIFTKIPAFTMIPLVGFLVYTNSNNNKSLMMLGYWLIPVILIPLIWPAHAFYTGQFNLWLNGVVYQTHREDIEGLSFSNSINSFFQIDPVLLILGIAGLVFAAIKRDFMLLLWVIPFLIFIYFIGHVFVFYLMPLLPAFCIAAAKMINDLSYKIRIKKFQQIIPFAVISAIGVFGLISITMLVSTNINSSWFEGISFITQYPHGNNAALGYKQLLSSNTLIPDVIGGADYTHKVTIIAGDTRYFWIPQLVFHKDYDYKWFWSIEPLKAEKVLLIVDEYFTYLVSSSNNINKEYVKQMQAIYNSTHTISAFKRTTDIYNPNAYPYTSMRENWLPLILEMRTNDDKAVFPPSSLLNSSSTSAFTGSLSYNNTMNPSQWKTLKSGSGPTVTKNNQRFEINIPANSSSKDVIAAGMMSLYQLKGNFDVQVEYKLLNWPLHNGIRIALIAHGVINSTEDPNRSVERASFGSKMDQPYEVYLTNFHDNSTTTTTTKITTDMSGKLRITRSGFILTSYYYKSGNWIPMHSVHEDPKDVNIALLATTTEHTFSHQDIKIVFDNFVINKGFLVVK